MLFQMATWKLFMHHWKDNCLRMRVVQDQCVLKFLIIARAMIVWLLEVATPTYVILKGLSRSVLKHTRLFI